MDEYVEMLEEALAGTGFSVYDPEMGMDCLVQCDEHGSVMEPDGRGPCGCMSPLRALGLM